MAATRLLSASLLFLLGMLALQGLLQAAELFFDFLAAFDGVEEDVVGIAELLFPFVVQAPETGGVFLLQIPQKVTGRCVCG